MKRESEMRTRFFSEDPRFDFLTAEDRYLFASEKPRFRFNIIGAGTIGQEHMKVTFLEGRATIHGLYDPHKPSIEIARREMSKYTGAEPVIYETLSDCLNDPAVDALIICTPNYTHIDIVRKAALSGKHILLEKPMATSVQDAWSVMNIANQYEAVFQIGLQYRYKSIYAEAIHEVKKRKCVGDIKLITMAEHRPPFLDKVGQWNKFSCYSGGTLVEKCCHYFDLINLFAEAKPLSVFASGGMGVNFRDFEYAGKKSDIIDNAIVTIDYENGIRANFTLSMFSPIFYEELVLCGDEGRLKATEEFDFFHGQETKSSVVINRGEDAASRSITPMYTSFIEKSGHSGATFFEHKHFVDKIDGKPTSSASAEDGFWSVVVGSAAEESIRSGQPVKIANILAKANAACVDQ